MITYSPVFSAWGKRLQGSQPNVITYSRCSAHVESAGCLRGPYSSSLICSSRDSSSSDHLYNSDQCIQSNMITYSAVICACGKGGMPEGLLQLFGELQQQGLLSNVIT